MASATQALAEAPATELKERLRRIGTTAEDLALTLSLAGVVLLPLAEVVLRRVAHTSISGVTSIVQHLTLLSGILGGMIAAREGKLLSLSSVNEMLKGRVKTVVQVFTNGVAACVAVVLCVAAAQFVQTEHIAAKILAYGIPVWCVQLILPIGFAIITLRIVVERDTGWKFRIGTMAVTIALLAILLRTADPHALMVPGIVVVVITAVLGLPIFATLGGVALLLLWAADVPLAAVTLDNYRLVTNPVLPTVPLFTLAGYFLAEGGASKRFIRVFKALVGQFRAGPAILTAFVCAFFTAFTGGSGVTILALGGLLMPVLLQAKYSEKSALGLLTGSGSLGLLLPPCLPLIFYAVIAQVSIKDMFLGGIVPGLILVFLTCAWAISQAPKDAAAVQPFRLKEALESIWEAKWELLVPVVAFAGLFGGFATPVESAALTALYAFFVETFVYRDLKFFRDTTRVVTDGGLLVGGVLLILGVAMGLTNYLVDAEVPTNASIWITANIHSKWLFLLLLNLFLIVVGAIMDIFSAMVIVVPLIVPIGAAFGINPIHLGIIFLTNAELGYLMPPVGENLFLASYRFDKPVSEVFRSVIPMMLVFLFAVALVTYVPALTTALPEWFSK